MKTRRFFYFGKFAVLGLLGVVTFTFIVMWLWNWLVPELFNGPVVTYWQTLGLLLLSKILFSGIGKGHHDRQSCYPHDYPKQYKDKWKRKFEEKMNGKVDDKKDEGEVIVTE
ncbi:MAG: hypothetical protein KAR19_19400 [Bacteroidales bacterium]|nr:hypothetical protein [Bacteroidales bacterium]